MNYNLIIFYTFAQNRCAKSKCINMGCTCNCKRMVWLEMHTKVMVEVVCELKAKISHLWTCEILEIHWNIEYIFETSSIYMNMALWWNHLQTNMLGNNSSWEHFKFILNFKHKKCSIDLIVLNIGGCWLVWSWELIVLNVMSSSWI